MLEIREISFQIIQSLAMLILNISTKPNLYYIFSNNFLNQLFSQNYEKYEDDELLAYYINLVKSLALKIDNLSIQFFFHPQYNSFSLLESALRIYNHRDSMIRTSVRNIFLTFMKRINDNKLVKNESIYEYVVSLPTISYFAFISCNLRDLVLKVNNEVIPDEHFKGLSEVNDEIIDLIYYLQDIFSLKIDKVNFVLTNSLMYYFILPILINSLVSLNKVTFHNISL